MARPASLELRVHHVAPRLTNVVGPGARAVVWVQGCAVGCSGCLVPETWSPRRGRVVDPRQLAPVLLADHAIEGLTVSGGEPTEQPEAVTILLNAFRNAGRNTWLYSGHTLEELVARDDPAIDRLLACADVLIDGPYRQEESCTVGFRGSRNQRLIPLSEIGRKLIARSGAGRLQIRITAQEQLQLFGVPPRGFHASLEARLRERGVSIRAAAGDSASWGAAS